MKKNFYQNLKFFELEKYNPSHKRINDLIHTKLELSFDWENETVLGKATLELEPFFYATDQVTLDAKNFVFHQVSYAESDDTLAYSYDGQKNRYRLRKRICKRGKI